MSKNSEQTGTPASRHREPLLFVGKCVCGPVFNASQLLILLVALFLVSLFPGGILLHLFSCYVLHSVCKLVSANSVLHFLLWTHLVYSGFTGDA